MKPAHILPFALGIAFASSGFAQWAPNSTPELREAFRSRPQPAPAQRQPTVYEAEATAYASASAEFQKIVAQGMSDREISAAFDSYWQRRLELAEKQDRGQVSAEAAQQLRAAYYQQFAGVVERRTQELAMQAAQAIAQQQAQAEARRMEQSMQMFNLGLQLLTPKQPQVAPPVSCRWVGANWVCM